MIKSNEIKIPKAGNIEIEPIWGPVFADHKIAVAIILAANIKPKIRFIKWNGGFYYLKLYLLVGWRLAELLPWCGSVINEKDLICIQRLQPSDLTE